MPPNPQILRLKDWFFRYDFFVKHIKGKNNLIPDFLSKPNNKTIKVITSTHSFPLIFMVKPLSETTKTIKVFPPGLMTQTPAQILEYAKSHYFHFLLETIDSNTLQHKYLTLRYHLEVYLNCSVRLGGICVNQPYGPFGVIQYNIQSPSP